MSFTFTVMKDGVLVDPSALSDEERDTLFQEAKDWTASLRRDSWEVLRGNVISTPDDVELNLTGAPLKFFKKNITDLNLTDSACMHHSDLDVKHARTVQTGIRTGISNSHAKIAVGTLENCVVVTGFPRTFGELYVKPVKLDEYFALRTEGKDAQVERAKVAQFTEGGKSLYKIGRTGQGETTRALQQKLPLGKGSVATVSRHDESTMEKEMNAFLKEKRREVVLLNNDGSPTQEIRALTDDEYQRVLEVFQNYGMTRAGWKKAFEKFKRTFETVK